MTGPVREGKWLPLDSPDAAQGLGLMRKRGPHTETCGSGMGRGFDGPSRESYARATESFNLWLMTLLPPGSARALTDGPEECYPNGAGTGVDAKRRTESGDVGRTALGEHVLEILRYLHRHFRRGAVHHRQRLDRCKRARGLFHPGQPLEEGASLAQGMNLSVPHDGHRLDAKDGAEQRLGLADATPLPEVLQRIEQADALSPRRPVAGL